jgi:hypothetical protein
VERQPQVPNILRLPSEPRLALPKAVSCRPQCRSCHSRRARQRRVPGGISAGGCAGVQGCLKQACPASPGCLATDGRLAFWRWTQASDRRWQRWFWLEVRHGNWQENTSISIGCLGLCPSAHARLRHLARSVERGLQLPSGRRLPPSAMPLRHEWQSSPDLLLRRWRRQRPGE